MKQNLPTSGKVVKIKILKCKKKCDFSTFSTFSITGPATIIVEPIQTHRSVARLKAYNLSCFLGANRDSLIPHPRFSVSSFEKHALWRHGALGKLRQWTFVSILSYRTRRPRVGKKIVPIGQSYVENDPFPREKS
jgi:hypothetical protein